MRRSGQPIDTNVAINWSIVKQLLPFLTEFKWRALLAIVFLILAKLATVVLPFILKAIVDSLVPNTTSADSNQSTLLNFNQQYQYLLAPVSLVIAYGALRFLNVLFGEIRDTLFSRVTERTIRRISLSVFQHLHQLDINFHLNRKTGGLSRDIERGTHGISFLMRFMVFNIIPTLLEISLVVGILLTNYGWEFGLITSTAILIYICFSVVVTNWRNQYVRAANSADSQSNTRAIDSLLNYETVKYFTNEKFEAQRYDSDLKNWEAAKLKNRLSLSFLNAGQALIISIAVASLLYLAVGQVSQGLISVGDFVLINAFMMQLFMPLNFLGFVYREIRVAIVNIEKMFELLATKPSVIEQPNAQTLTSLNQPISFDRVSFGYQSNRQILKQISFNILPNQTVAIVGSSGSGKSTLVKLLLRFYDPTHGTIQVGSTPLTQFGLASLRAHIGVVPQDTVLFNDSIFENVRYGKPTATDREVERAIQLAHLQQFIEELPEGRDTLVGERGLKLSGGEKQRVAIARALIKQPQLLVFDEATSSLDSISENKILSAIKEIAADYTSLIIAHRLSTIVHADTIIVLQQGEIKEQGSHTQLLAAQGAYYKLWQKQQHQKASS
ncbi:ABCB family ABC transporter ATP-binding protein/permease [Aliikangiella sp. IMCC44632]